jgi:hypothetical protein
LRGLELRAVLQISGEFLSVLADGEECVTQRVAGVEPVSRAV